MKPEDIVVKVASLRPPSQTVVRLAGLLSRADGGNDDVIDLIKRDVVLCAKVLALCNSAQFGLSRRIGSVDQAVLYVGYRQIYRMVMAVGFGNALNRPLPAYAIHDEDLWRHSLLTAQLSEHMVSEGLFEQTDASVAYTAGLVHDIGKVAMSQFLDPKLQNALRDLITQKTCSRLEAERTVLQMDHAELGACLLEQWLLPTSIVEAVARHHRPNVAGQPTLAAVVHIANCLAHQLVSTPGWEAFEGSVEGSAALALEINSENYASLVMAGQQQMEQVRQLATAV